MASGHIAHCLGGILARRASAAVVVSGGLRLTGAELVDDVRGLAAGLWESGLRPGDVVAVVGFNRCAHGQISK
jgi:acyl-activating enzyme 14